LETVDRNFDPPFRSAAGTGALFMGAFGLLSLAAVFFLWFGFLGKLNWYEGEDWGMTGLMMGWFALPAALVSLAFTCRLGRAAYPTTDPEARRSRWIVRLAGLVFLVLPLTLLNAWRAPVGFDPNAPSPEERAGRVALLTVLAGLSTLVALYGWIVPRATVRGWIRASAAMIGATIVVDSTWILLAEARTISMSDLGVLVAGFAPLSIACIVAWFVSRDSS